MGKADAVYHHSNQGGSEWGTSAVCPKSGERSAAAGARISSPSSSAPTGFKHTGVFPERAVNWAWYAKDPCRRLTGKGAEPVPATPAVPRWPVRPAGATVCHGCLKGIVAWEQGQCCGKRPCRPAHPLAGGRLVPGSLPAKNAAATPTTASSWAAQLRAQPHGGEIWKLEDCIYGLISQCEGC